MIFGDDGSVDGIVDAFSTVYKHKNHENWFISKDMYGKTNKEAIPSVNLLHISNHSFEGTDK